ncbi:MAG: acetyltransferase [Alkalinema sp. FL-bin-369]|nr:acetyltransferase [Leptolyngbyaceae cyanobacterium LF-bin-369]
MLFNPNQHEILGRIQSGEEEQETAAYGKVNLTFLSGEALPLCWMDVNYRKTM